MVVPNHVLTDAAPEFEDRSESDVLYVGQLTQRKRVDVLIDAVVTLSEGLGRTITLTVIGEGPLIERLQQQAHDVGASVRWVPPQPHGIVLDHMKRCTVYAHASEFEGHPRAVIEAMSMGAPVIVADSPGLQNVVEHGVTGLRTDVSAEAFCHVLGGLFFDSEWRQQLGREASSRVRQRFGLASVLVQELEVHRRAVDLIGMSGRRLRAPVCLSMAQAEGDAPSWMAALHAHASSLPPDDRRAFYSAMAQSMLQHAA
ncbi:MAG: glycosyltransferase, partial [Phycisphaerales bacterium]|nr:glycosyltransferase [Phycisphaerales bacterium]